MKNNSGMGNDMKERPIIFNSKNIRAILEGRKTQTRRPLKEQPPQFVKRIYQDSEGTFWGSAKTKGTSGEDYLERECPYGEVGDRLWVKHDFYDLIPPPTNPENYQIWDEYTRCVRWEKWTNGEPGQPLIKDVNPNLQGWRHRPSIHMPRWASRITLEITNVRVERIREITKDDMIAEGYSFEDQIAHWSQPFTDSWNKIYPGSWVRNDWVWVIEFR